MQNMNHYRALYYPAFEPNIKWLKSHLILVDEISRIIPKDAGYEASDSIKVLKDLMPGVITEYDPSSEDVTVDDLNLRRLENAFKIIRDKRDKGRPVDTSNIVVSNGMLEFPGRVMLHDKKLCEEVHHLLKYYHLIDPALTTIARAVGGQDAEDYWVTNQEASDLVLSCVADKIARKNGLDTITDQHLAFSLTDLDGLGVRSTPTAGSVEGSLLSAMTSVSISVGVEHLAPEKYKELRDSFAEIRSAFQLLIRELVLRNRLDQIEDETALRERIDQIAKAFDAKVGKYRQTRFGRSVRAWAPLYVGGLISIGSAFVCPPVAAVLAGVSLSLQVIDRKINASAPPGATEQCCRLVGDLTDAVVDMYYPRLLLQGT